MTEIVPRWEWRAFGERFGAAEEGLDALTPERVQDSDELSELRTDRGSARTIAVESEDPARVVATVRELGLERRPNVSVPRQLKTLAAMTRTASRSSTSARTR